MDHRPKRRIWDGVDYDSDPDDDDEKPWNPAGLRGFDMGMRLGFCIHTCCFCFLSYY